MTNKRYVAGRAYEYRVKKKLEKEGWTVLRTAGSHGLFDIIAIAAPTFDMRRLDTGRIKLIQAKSGKSKLRMVKDVLKTDIKKWEGFYSVSVEVV